jgi:hypothetical protein
MPPKKPTILLRLLKTEKPKKKSRTIILDKKRFVELNSNLREEKREKSVILREIKEKLNAISDLKKSDFFKYFSKELERVGIKIDKKDKNKQIKEIIEIELKKLLEFKKKNKTNIIKLEINKSIFSSYNEIIRQTKEPKTFELISFYNTIILNLTYFSNRNLKDRRTLFLNQALKQINNQILNSENLNDTLLDIYLKIKHVND